MPTQTPVDNANTLYNDAYVVVDLRANYDITETLSFYGEARSYLRLSVTDRCDLRCTYCMAETMTFLPRKEVLSLEEH